MTVVETVVAVKLGGSLITDKAEKDVLRTSVLGRLAHELADSVQGLSDEGVGLILGHGSGSFGHFAAQAVGYDKTSLEPGSGSDACKVQSAALELHGHVLRALRSAGLPCFSLQPASFLVAEGGVVRLSSQASLEPLEVALRQGLVPVVFGDVILDSSLGFTIASTETVLTLLLDGIRPGFSMREALWLGETDGLLDDQGRSIETLDEAAILKLRAAIGSARGADVTGGMHHRLDTVIRLSKLGMPSRLLNGLRVGVLTRALAGANAGGTRIEALAAAGKPEGKND